MNNGIIRWCMLIISGLILSAIQTKFVFAEEGEFYGSKVVFIVDKSGSMSEKPSGQNETQLSLIEKEVIKQVDEYQRKEAEVLILAFDIDVYDCTVGDQGEALYVVKKIGKRVEKERLSPGGNTDIILALSEAMKRLDNVANPIVYLYTDGKDTVSRPGYTFESLIEQYNKYVKDNKRPWGLYYVTLGFEVDPNTKRWLEEGLNAETVPATPERPNQWATVEYKDIEFVCSQKRDFGKDIETTEATIRVHTVPTFSKKRVEINVEFEEKLPSGVSIEPVPNSFKFGDKDLHLRLKIHNPAKLPVKRYAMHLQLSSTDDKSINFVPSPSIPAHLSFSRIYTLLLKKDGLPQDKLFLGHVEPGKECGLSLISELLPHPDQTEMNSPELQSKVTLERPENLNKYGFISFNGLEGKTLKNLAETQNVDITFQLNDIIKKPTGLSRRIIMFFPLRVEGPLGLEPSELICEIVVPSWLSQRWAVVFFPLLAIVFVVGMWIYYLKTRKQLITVDGEFLLAGDSVGKKLKGSSGYIGSNPNCFIQLPESEGVAPKHVQVVKRIKKIFLEHVAGDEYQTIVNGETIRGMVSLDDGAEIKIGNNVINYKMPEKVGDEDVFGVADEEDSSSGDEFAT